MTERTPVIRNGSPEYRTIEDPREIDCKLHGLIEASAGTGKTYTIEHLVLRLVRDEGIPIDRILVVTFTEKATGELKERIRKKLSDEFIGQPDPDTSEYRRLQSAIDGFDNAGIHTIHGFCHLVLSRYGFELGRPLSTEVVDDQPLIQLLLQQRMRRRWPTVFGEDLAELLEFSGFPEYDARLDESRWERRIRRVILSSAAEPATIPPAPGSLEQVREDFLRLRADAISILAELKKLMGPIDSDDPGASAFAAGYSRLNQKAPSRNRKLKNFIVPLLHIIHDTTTRDASPLVAITRFLQAANRADLDPETGFRTLSEEHWAKAGDNISEVCPGLPLVVEALERMRALDFFRMTHALTADTITGVAEDLKDYKRSRAFVSFNDMLRLVNDALESEQSALTEILREQFTYAIVDEFQDTDPVQWEIFRRLYLADGARGVLYLVGDPKQAIYGFRGADVFAYFGARRELERRAAKSQAALYRLSTNYRSTPEMVRVFNDLFATPAFFGSRSQEPPLEQDSDELIGYTPALESKPELRKIQIAADETGRGALQLVRLDTAGSGTMAKRAYFRFLAREIHALVVSRKIQLASSGSPSRPLDFGDVCILLRTRSDAPLMEDALERLGVPHSFYKKTGLYQSKEALELSLVLRAIETPARLESGYKAGLTRFFRFSPEAIDALRITDLTPGEGDEPPFRGQINRWHTMAERRNWPAFFRSLLQDSLALLPAAFAVELDSQQSNSDLESSWYEPQYERGITNYEQICDELAEHAVRENFDLTGLIEHLDLLRTEGIPVREEWDVHRQESEEARVKLMTIHTAKGLEFPVVCIAGGFTRRMAHLYETFEYHNEDGTRIHDLMRSDEIRFRAEEEAEERRLYYVALTRAAIKLYVPYYRPADPRGKNTAGPLARFVRDAIDTAYSSKKPEGEDVTGTDVDDTAPQSKPGASVHFLEPEQAGDFLDPKPRKSTDSSVSEQSPRAMGGEIDKTRSFDRQILFPDGPLFVSRRRQDLLSYTALSHGTVANDGATDESDTQADEFVETSRDREDHAMYLPGQTAGFDFLDSSVAIAGPELSPQIRELDRLMRGADAGTMLHDILEQLEYTGLDGNGSGLQLTETNRRLIARQLRRNGFLSASAATPPTADHENMTEAERIEYEAVDFVGQLLRRVLWAPLTGVAENFMLKDLAKTNRIHEMEFYFHVPRLFENVRRELDRMGEDEHQALRFQDGYVWGFIDLVFRYGGRYYLADWKSNILNDYSPPGLEAAMTERQYHLQYQIYSYALLRWLKNHIPDFQYDRDFGGAYYFFLRGMNPASPGQGVFFARPTAEENSVVLEEIRARAFA